MIKNLHATNLTFSPGLLSETVEALERASLDGFSQIILDLDAWSALSDEGIRGLITLLRESRRLGLELIAETAVDQVRDDFAQAGLDRLMPLRRGEVAA